MEIAIVILLAFLSVGAAQNYPKPAILPLDKRPSLYFWKGGERVATVQAGTPTQNVGLVVSNTLSHGWLVGVTMCNASDVLAWNPGKDCAKNHMGVFDGQKSKTWTVSPTSPNSALIQNDLLAGVYHSNDFNATNELMVQSLADLGPPSSNANPHLLGIEGWGSIGSDTIQLNFTNDQTLFGLSQISLGLTAPYPQQSLLEWVPVGYLSAQQLAFELYKAKRIASPTYHLIHGPWQTDQHESDFYHLVVFGGYDSQYLDLNKSMQYPLTEVQLSSSGNVGSKQLPPSKDVAYRMEIFLDSLEWDSSGGANYSLLDKNPQGYRCILDTTTPYIWLPRSITNTFATRLNAKYNDSMGLYTFSGADTQWSADGTLRFLFRRWAGEQLVLTKDSLRHYNKPGSSDDFSGFLQVRPLPTPSTQLADGEKQMIILGRPFFSEIQVFANFMDGWWAMNQGGKTALTNLWVKAEHSKGMVVTPQQPQVVEWDVNNPPKITNTSLLVVGNKNQSQNPGAIGGTGTGNGRKGAIGPGVIAGIAVGACLVILSVGVLARCVHISRKRSKSGIQHDDGKIPVGGFVVSNSGALETPHELHGSVSKLAWAKFKSRKRRAHLAGKTNPTYAHELDGKGIKYISGLHEMDGGSNAGLVTDTSIAASSVAIGETNAHSSHGQLAK